ncbi:hypothetical protein B7P34_36150, partial [Streptosporangium nondiastaticum]
MSRLLPLDAAAHIAEMFAGSANDSGDLRLVLACVHSLDDEQVESLLAALVGCCVPDQPSHHGLLLSAHENTMLPWVDLSSEQGKPELTPGPVTAKILCNQVTYSRLSYQAGPGVRRT